LLRLTLALAFLAAVPGPARAERGQITALPPLAPQTSHLFADSGQALGGNAESHAVALGDLDGDGDLDALVANYDTSSQVWVNQAGAQGGAAGQFSNSGQALGEGRAVAVALGDLDGDGDLDVFIVADLFAGSNQVWLNQGGAQGGSPGVFAFSGQVFGHQLSRGVALGDLDGDGDLDAVVAKNAGNTVWLNNGAGIFSDSGQGLGAAISQAVALGRLNADNHLDAFFANNGANTAWFNNGSGVFADTLQGLGSAFSLGVALGDLDGDGDLDAFVANWSPPANKVWLNNGSGLFTDSGQSLGNASSFGVALADVNGDNALDAIVANQSRGLQVWLNNGSGTYTSGQILGDGTTTIGVAVGDLDLDGNLDIFAANGGPNRVWINQAAAPPQQGANLSISVIGRDYVQVEPGLATIAYFSVTVRNLGPQMATGVSAYGTSDFFNASQGQCAAFPFLSCTQWLFGDLAPGQSATADYGAVVGVPFASVHGDKAVHRAATAEVSVSGIQADSDQGNNRSTFTTYFFHCDALVCVLERLFCKPVTATGPAALQSPGRSPALAAEGPAQASGWLQPLQDFVIDLAVYYLIHDRVLMGTAAGQHYAGLYYAHDEEITAILEADAGLEAQAVDTLQMWEPNLWALVRGQGASAIITADQVAAMDSFLTSLSAAGSPALKQAIAQERERLGPLDTYAGMTMAEARGQIVGYGLHLPLVTR
jgi:hypothetical protein